MHEDIDKLKEDNERATHTHNETVDKLHLELNQLRDTHVHK